MSTYSVRCRHQACRHRRVAGVHPDDYKVVPKCPACGHRKGWRIENRDYNKKGSKKNPVCRCSGPEMVGGYAFPHRTNHPLCDNNPNGERNQALHRGAKAEELPLELMGEAMKDTDDCPF